MASPTTPGATAGVGGGRSRGRRNRRPPSPAEQRRREAWGKQYGQLAAAAIKDAIKRAEAA